MNALIANARFHFHERLFETNTLTLTKAGVASNADTSSRGSKAIAGKIVDILVDEHHHDAGVKSPTTELENLIFTVNTDNPPFCEL